LALHHNTGEEGISLMSKIKKVFGLTVSVAAAMFAFGASSAFAADTATCAFTGLAGNLTPPIPAAANDPGGVSSIERGTYNFAGDATCVKLDTDTDDAANNGVYGVRITSNGDYENQVCGTGKAYGRTLGATQLVATSGTSLAGAAGWEGPIGATYDITFTGGAGALVVHQAQNSERTSSNGTNGGGYVQIIPADGNCVTTDVGAFTVAGSFSAIA
jgi:hypothetical protein